MFGLFTAFVFYVVCKLKILQDSDTVPDFLVNWINIIIPVFTLLAIGMVVIYYLDLDIAGAISNIFAPFLKLGQSYIGMLLLCIMPGLLACFGVSGWAFTAFSYPIYLSAIAENVAAVANGLAATNIVNIPAQTLQTGQIPGPVACVLVTKDFRALIWWVLCFVLYAIENRYDLRPICFMYATSSRK